MTDVALRDHLEAQIRSVHERLTAINERTQERFALADAAVQKAETMLSKRLDSMNEFRDALRDQGSRMATRDELERLEKQIYALESRRANVDGQLYILAAALSLIVSLAVAFAVRFIG